MAFGGSAWEGGQDGLGWRYISGQSTAGVGILCGTICLTCIWSAGFGFWE